MSLIIDEYPRTIGFGSFTSVYNGIGEPIEFGLVSSGTITTEPNYRILVRLYDSSLVQLIPNEFEYYPNPNLTTKIDVSGIIRQYFQSLKFDLQNFIKEFEFTFQDVSDNSVDVEERSIVIKCLSGYEEINYFNFVYPNVFADATSLVQSLNKIKRIYIGHIFFWSKLTEAEQLYNYIIYSKSGEFLSTEEDLLFNDFNALLLPESTPSNAGRIEFEATDGNSDLVESYSIYPNCANPVYLTWINSRGGVDQMLFSHNQEVSFVNRGGNRYKQVRVFAYDLTYEEWEAMHDLFRGGEVYEDKDGIQWRENAYVFETTLNFYNAPNNYDAFNTPVVIIPVAQIQETKRKIYTFEAVVEYSKEKGF